MKMVIALLFFTTQISPALGSEDCPDCAKKNVPSIQIGNYGDWSLQIANLVKDKKKVLSTCTQVVESLEHCGSHKFAIDEKNLKVKILSTGETIPCADSNNDDFYTRMNKMDVISTLSMPYKKGEVPLPVKSSSDPGRLRNHQLLGTEYGKSKEEVTANLVEVQFLGQPVNFNKENGAARALENVGKKLDNLIATNPKVKNFLFPWTKKEVKTNDFAFFFRKVAGTNLLSMHSYGVALDLLSEKEQLPTYWLWEEAKRRAKPFKDKKNKDIEKIKAAAATRKANSSALDGLFGSEANAEAQDKKAIQDLQKAYLAKFEEIRTGIKEEEIKAYAPEEIETLPWEIVSAFESEGFIWGGKWNHFDSMHFEYRPEFYPGLKVDCSPFPVAPSQAKQNATSGI